MASLSDLIAELKRRRVFRAAAMYIVAAWVVIQAASIILPALHFPSWTLTFVVAVAILGLPLTIGLAWAFDLTPRRRGIVAVGFGAVATVLALSAVFARSHEPKDNAQDRASGRSIAVLPFTNMSGAADREYFSDGITEDILTKLAQIPGLEVASRTSVMRYKKTEKSAREIGQELDVSVLLEGSVRQSGDQVLITAQLIDARADRHIWAEEYKRGVADIFEVQNEIARKITSALALRISTAEMQRVVRRYTDNPRAYDLYLRGRFLWNRRSTADLTKAIDYYKQALAVDPDYALAYSGLAETYATPSSPLRPAESRVEAKLAARRALQLDPALARAQAALAYAMIPERDWRLTEAAFKKAIAMDSSYATAHQWYAEFLASRHRFDEAITEVKIAESIDPFSMVIGWNVARTLVFAGRDEQALQQLRKVQTLYPDDGRVRHGLQEALIRLRRYDELRTELPRLLPPSSTPRQVAKAQAALERGIPAYYESRLELVMSLTKPEPQSRGAVSMLQTKALLYALLGRAAEAMDCLEQLERDGEISSALFIEISASPDYDLIRNDPRFKQLVHRLGVPVRVPATATVAPSR